MGLFTKKPTTVLGVFEKAVEDIRVIQDAKVAEANRLAKEQESNVAALEAEQKRLDEEEKRIEQEFRDKSKANADARAAAEKERMAAGKVIKNFAEMFGVAAK